MDEKKKRGRGRQATLPALALIGNRQARVEHDEIGMPGDDHGDRPGPRSRALHVVPKAVVAGLVTIARSHGAANTSLMVGCTASSGAPACGARGSPEPTTIRAGSTPGAPRPSATLGFAPGVCGRAAAERRPRGGRYIAGMTPLTPALVLLATAIPVGRARRQLGRSRILATPLAARRRADLEERLFDALASGDRERLWHYRRALGR